MAAMDLVRVHPDPSRPLEPGRYFVYIDAPVAVLDGMAKMPNVGRSIVHLLFDLSGADVVYLGSGTTWSRENGELRRVFSVSFEVPATPAAPVYFAGGANLLGWALAAGLFAIAGSITFAVYYVRQSVPAEDLPGVVEDVRDTTRAVASITGWLVFGGLAVGGYLVAKNQRWIE